MENKNADPRFVRSEKVDLDKALELTGFGKYHVGLIFVCGPCMIITILETLGMGYVFIAARCDFALSMADKGYLSGVTYAGMICSSHAWDLTADKIGRKRALLMSLWGTWFFSFLSSLAPNFGLLLGLRFVTGLFLTGISSIVYTYLCEFLPAKIRSRYMTWTCGSASIAYLMMPSIAWLILPLDISWNLGYVVVKPWRVYAMAIGALTFINGIAFLFYPETPKFFMSVGKKDEALEVLRSIFASNTGKSPEEYPVKDLKFEVEGVENGPEIVSDGQKNWRVSASQILRVIGRQAVPLFRYPYLWQTILFSIIQFGIYASAVSMTIWLPTIMNMALSNGMSSKTGQSLTICDIVSLQVPDYEIANATSLVAKVCDSGITTGVYVSAFLIGVFFVISYAIYGMIISIIGKRGVLVSAQLIAGSAAIAIYFTRNNIWLMVFMTGYLVLGTMCISVVGATIFDLYPTNYRAMAVTMGMTAGRVGSTIAGAMIGIALETNCDATWIAMGCITLGCGLLCILIPKRKHAENESEK